MELEHRCPRALRDGGIAMSWWFRVRDKDGRVHYVGVEVPFFLLFALTGISLALLLGQLVAAPIPTMLLFFSVTVIGFVFFAIAKLSVMVGGRPVSFGSAGMRPAMRAMYHAGYVLMAVGAVLTLLSIALVSRM
jgi:hypothetical protein